jgi:hypothetical protein
VVVAEAGRAEERGREREAEGEWRCHGVAVRVVKEQRDRTGHREVGGN